MIMLTLSDYVVVWYPESLEALIVVTALGIVAMYLVAVSSYHILWTIE